MRERRGHAEHVQRADRAAIEGRFRALQPDSPRQWGKMSRGTDAGALCSGAGGASRRPAGETQSLLGRVITPFIRSSVFGEAPLRRNTPADADCLIADERDFLDEQRRLLEKVARFCDRGPAGGGPATSTASSED